MRGGEKSASGLFHWLSKDDFEIHDGVISINQGANSYDLIKEGKLKRDKNETYIFKNSDDNSYYEQIDGETVCIDDDLPFEIPQS